MAAKQTKKSQPKPAPKAEATPKVPAFVPGKPPRFFLESKVYPAGGQQYNSADPFEGEMAIGRYPKIAYDGRKLVISGEARINDPGVIVKLLKCGGRLRYDAQEIIDSGLVSFDQVVELLGPEPFFWENGPMGIRKFRKSLVNTQAGEVPSVDREPDVPIKRVQLMDLEELRDLADMFGIYLPAKVGLAKAREDFLNAFEDLTPEAKREGQDKWNAKATGKAKG